MILQKMDSASMSCLEMQGSTKALRTESGEAEVTNFLPLHISSRLMKNFKQILQKQQRPQQQQQQQPKPLPPKRSHASFLEDLVEPLPSSPAPKRYRPESVKSFVTHWVESTSGSEIYRQRNCRSDTLLRNLHGEFISRRFTKSAPGMECRRDSNGFALPPTPASIKPRSDHADAESWGGPSVAPSDMTDASTGSTRKTLVEDPYYRNDNLAENNIYFRDFWEEFPEDISRLVDDVRKDRDSPGPSSDQLRQDTRLYALEKGTAEPAVENYFKANIFPDPGELDGVQRIDKSQMVKQFVPNVGSKLKVSTPVPDILYGYNRLGAFPEEQIQLQFRSMGKEMLANTQELVYPFFVIEFKADGPGGSGSMWVATNQCLGASATCVSISERLNRRLRQCTNPKVQPIDSAAFSIAMNGTEARLYVSWKHDELKYYMRKVDSFLLQKPREYVEFRKHVLNIIDWGKEKRLKEIRRSLESLLEKNRKIASEEAKSRPPPSDDSGSGSGRKRKSSSSRGGNGKGKGGASA
ncbi:hypothetical protein G7Y89_g7042 [Cudoniella acicularis]|uniref:DUF7924 domain-containing protein n=1 Tax=Cudoniella acicularis TaxID=354080 RepID=A0A8H4RJC5_9HELO|nr:hypothetical protein G7Y89_g7042 [Cudoniella acicularis]